MTHLNTIKYQIPDRPDSHCFIVYNILPILIGRQRSIWTIWFGHLTHRGSTGRKPPRETP